MKNYTTVLLIAAILVIINLLSSRFFLRADLTADSQFTLGKATKNILKDLEEPVTVTAYFTEGLTNPQVATIRNDFKDLLIEYNNRSKGKVAYEFKNPNEDEALEKEIQQKGIQPVMIQERNKDAYQNQKAYLAANVQIGEQNEIIPFIQPGGAMEYALTTSIKKLAAKNKPSIGFVQGHGEPPLQEMMQAYQSMSILYTPEPVNLTASIPAKFQTIAIIAPKDSFPPQQFQILDEFLGRGGNLFLGINAVNGDFSTAQGTALTTGLEGWLRTKGIQIENSFIIDAKCGNISVRQGNFPFPMQVNFPYFPNISKFSDHPITKGLESAMLQFASPITFMGGDSSLKFTPIAFTSERSGSINVPMQFDVQKRWGGNDFPMSNLPVAGVLEGNISGNVASKIVIVSDGDFAVNGAGQQQQQKQPDNISLLVNGVDWLSDDTGLIDLRTRGVTSRPLKELTDSRRSFLKYLNFLLPIGLVLLYGFFRFNRRRSQRMKRMQENYG